MKSFIIRMFAGNAIRLGVRYAYEAVNAVIAALRGVVEYGSIPDETRKKIAIVIDALSAVSDFLSKVVTLVGAPLISTSASYDLGSQAEKLRRITAGI